MSTITADTTVEKWFEQLKTVTEICDSTGKVLGVFTPSNVGEEAAVYAKLRQVFDPAKTERIFAQERDKGRPLADILNDLEVREQQL